VPELIRRITSVEGRVARLALWAEAVRSRPAAAVAALIDTVVRRAAARDPVATVAYLPLLDLPSLTELAGPGGLAAVLMAAREQEDEACQLLLEHPGPCKAPRQLGPPPDPAIEALSLGRRKTLARGRRSPVLDRVLKDPDPRVVAEVLRNPRLREFEVLAIASRRPSPEEIFWLLTRAENWIQRPAVRRAMAMNPYSPPQLAAALAVVLADPDLLSIAETEGLHPAVRDGALEVLGWRQAAFRKDSTKAGLSSTPTGS
jgi:hypothetical protein